MKAIVSRWEIQAPGDCPDTDSAPAAAATRNHLAISKPSRAFDQLPDPAIPG